MEKIIRYVDSKVFALSRKIVGQSLFWVYSTMFLYNSAFAVFIYLVARNDISVLYFGSLIIMGFIEYFMMIIHNNERLFRIVNIEHSRKKDIIRTPVVLFFMSIISTMFPIIGYSVSVLWILYTIFLYFLSAYNENKTPSG